MNDTDANKFEETQRMFPEQSEKDVTVNSVLTKDEINNTDYIDQSSLEHSNQNISSSQIFNNTPVKQQKDTGIKFNLHD